VQWLGECNGSGIKATLKGSIKAGGIRYILCDGYVFPLRNG